MAEAAALALAAALVQRLQFTGTNFLSDNQQLGSFLNSPDHSTPPDWRMKHLTQQYITSSDQGNFRIFKIPRNINQTAHMLANTGICSCTNAAAYSCYQLLQCSSRTSVPTDRGSAICKHKRCNLANSSMLLKYISFVVKKKTAKLHWPNHYHFSGLVSK